VIRYGTRTAGNEKKVKRKRRRERRRFSGWEK
jgi:hypothetical protein